MTDDRSVERAARSWLDTGPTQAPDRAVEAALLRIQTTRQERDLRVPWRVSPMFPLRGVAAAAVIGVLAIGGLIVIARPGSNVGVTQTPSPSGSSSPSVPAASAGAAIGPLSNTYTSARYGYQVRYPAGWSTKAATSSWIAGTTNNWGSGLNDEIRGSTVRFSGASQLLGAGQTADAWMRAYAAGSDPSTWPTITVDGFTGRIDADGVPASGGTISPGGRMFDAVTVDGPYAFNFNMDGYVDRATFDAFLATVTLPVIPALDGSFTSSVAGYSIRYPSAWTVIPATKPWTSGYDTSHAGISDTIGISPGFAGTSIALPKGTSFAAWYAAYDAFRAGGTCRAAPQSEPVTIDGVVGQLDVHCPADYVEAVVLAGGRAYVFTVYGSAQRPMLMSMLATVKLMPGTAKN